MNVLTKKFTRVFVSVVILSGIQIIVGTVNSDAQSEADRIRDEVNTLDGESRQIINNSLQQEQQYISGLSCSQLLSEAQGLNKQGDYWAAQANTPHYASRAEGNYVSAQRRLNEYNRRCQ